MFKTRLMSIVSKPIKAVVVVIVVFIKKKVRSKTFLVQKIKDKENVVPKNSGSENFWSIKLVKKILSKKFRTKRTRFQKKFGPQKYLG